MDRRIIIICGVVSVLTYICATIARVYPSSTSPSRTEMVIAIITITLCVGGVFACGWYLGTIRPLKQK